MFNHTIKLRIAGLLLLLVVLILQVNNPCRAEESSYIALTRAAIAKADKGSTREALSLVNQAIDYDSDDQLTNALLGYLMLIGGRSKNAQNYFDKVLKSNPSNAYVLYCKAMISLNNGMPEKALEALARAQSSATELNMRPALEYAKYMCGGSPALVNSRNELLKFIEGISYAEKGENVKAISVFDNLLTNREYVAYKESPGLSASFDKKKPVTISAWLLRPKDKVLSPNSKNYKIVSGELSLKADLSHSASVRLVGFYVDDKTVRITNQSPFEHILDTQKLPDGIHTIRIDGLDSSGNIVSSKTARIFVKNHASGQIAKENPKEYAAAWDDFWDLIQIKPSATAINYKTALCAENLGITDRYIASLENVLAMDPDYLDARNRLIKAKGGTINNVKVYKSRAKLMRVALTFDDGPSKTIKTLLPILKQKNVKATFFVVGNQVEKYPDILRAIHNDGHEIENHTFYHLALSYLKERDIEKEYFSTSAAVRNTIGSGTNFIRPPGGRSGYEFYQFLRHFGVRTILWTINCVKEEGTNKNRIVNQVVRGIRPGAIILMHHGDMVTQQAVSKVIDELRSRRYEFVTVSELLAK